MLDGSTLRLHSQASPLPSHSTAKGCGAPHSLNKNHPFVDGNKRLAVAATEWFLYRNRFVLVTTNAQLLEFSLGRGR